MYVLRIYRMLGALKSFEGYFTGGKRLVGVDKELYPNASLEIEWAKKYKTKNMAEKMAEKYQEFFVQFIFEIKEVEFNEGT